MPSCHFLTTFNLDPKLFYLKGILSLPRIWCNFGDWKMFNPKHYPITYYRKVFIQNQSDLSLEDEWPLGVLIKDYWFLNLNLQNKLSLSKVKRTGWPWPFINYINFLKRRALYTDIANYSNFLNFLFTKW